MFSFTTDLLSYTIVMVWMVDSIVTVLQSFYIKANNPVLLQQ